MACNQRIALLVLAYFKLLLIDAVGCGFSGYNLVSHFVYRALPRYPFIILCVTAFIFFSNLVYGIVLLCGTHKSNRTLLSVFFWYSILGFILFLLQAVYTIYSYCMIAISIHAGWHFLFDHFETYLSIIHFGLINLVVQVCIMVLVRLQVRKLNTTSTPAGTELRCV